jgi:hypothetical protein
MKTSFPTLLLAIPIVAAVGCTKPDLDFARIGVGMSKNEVIRHVGNPTRTSSSNNIEVFEYDAYDHYGALRVNLRSQYIRFMDGKVESYGNKADFDPAKPPVRKREVEQKVETVKRDEIVNRNLGGSPAAAFDLRTELEKLEKLKKDGLITEAEFKELRQRVLEKAKAQ